MALARGLLALTRPTNAVVAGVLTFVGAYVAGGLDTPLPVAYAVAATILATGAGMAINDYFDREIDAINTPDRPIPSGAVPPRLALGFSIVLFAAAVGLAVLLPPLAIAIAAINLLALVSYTQLFKGTPGLGNAVVAYLGGSTFLFGAAAVGELTVAAIVLFVLAALSTLARELIKDVEDLPGDRAEGLRTLPVVVGRRPTLLLAAACLAIALLASPLPYLRGGFGVAYLAVVLPADAVMGAAAILAFRDPTLGQRWLKRGMYLAAVAFLVGPGAPIV